MSEEHKNKIRLANKGKNYSKETQFKIGHRLGMTGKKHSEKTKLKQSISRKGWVPSEEIKNKRIKTLLENNDGIFIGYNKGKKYPKELYPNYGLRKVRKNQIFPLKDSSIEVKIQNFLKEIKIGFFTHYYCSEINNSYQCDIFIPVQKNKDRFIKEPIIIECDGNYWHKYPVGRDIDKIRTSELLSKGFKVLRLWESEIKIMDLEKFKERIQ